MSNRSTDSVEDQTSRRLLQVEKTIEEALDNMTTYYKVNSLRTNPEKKSLRSISGIKKPKDR